MAGVRFEDVELLGALSRIVDLHTQHYKEDFDLDKELISNWLCQTVQRINSFFGCHALRNLYPA